MLVSNCCDAPVKWTDICTDCGEHCGVIDTEEIESLQEEAEKILNGIQLLIQNGELEKTNNVKVIIMELKCALSKEFLDDVGSLSRIIDYGKNIINKLKIRNQK